MAVSRGSLYPEVTNDSPLLLPITNDSRLYLQANPSIVGNFTAALKVKDWNLETDEWNQVGEELYGDTERDLFGSAVAVSADGETIAVSGVESNNNGHLAGEVKIIVKIPANGCNLAGQL